MIGHVLTLAAVYAIALVQYQSKKCTTEEPGAHEREGASYSAYAGGMSFNPS